MASIQHRSPIKSQPSLFDRLSERSSEDISEATLARGEMPVLDLEESITRDIGWLLNTTSLSATTDLSKWQWVKRSVLNFGIDVFAGKMLDNQDMRQIEATIRKGIELFEPRLRKESLKVHVRSDTEQINQRAILVQIEGEFMDRSDWKSFSLKVEIDSETGRLEVVP